MLRVLEELEQRHGGADAYLRSGGVEEAALSRLRARLLGRP
jgi:hypothetical protein